jgi:hypothetical protein
MVPAALLRRHAIMVSFAALPLLVFGAHAVSRPAPSPPVPVKLVQTEGVRVIRMDSQTFRARWSPVSDMPPATEVRYARTPTENASNVARGERVMAGTVSGTDISTAPPSRHRLRSRPAGLDICARHKMRRVMVRGGKSWRCRR